MIKTDGIDHVVLFVKDYERAKQFYSDLLGMTVHHEQPIGGFLNAGPGHLLALFQKERMHSWDEGRPGYHDARDVIGGSEFNRVSLTTDSGTRDSVKAERAKESKCTAVPMTLRASTLKTWTGIPYGSTSARWTTLPILARLPRPALPQHT